MHQFTALRLVHLIPDHAYLQPTQFWVTFNVTRSDVSVYIDFKHLITFYVASHIYSRPNMEEKRAHRCLSAVETHFNLRLRLQTQDMKVHNCFISFISRVPFNKGAKMQRKGAT